MSRCSNLTQSPAKTMGRRLLRPVLLCGLGVPLLMLAACGTTSAPPQKAQTAKAATPANYKVGNPYKINGRWYYPKEDPNYDQVGIASWYGPGFHRKQTANGEIYDMNALTAAHTTLPMPSYVRVTNLENNRSLILRVNDRGPFAKNRIIDVSRRAAQLLGFETKGTTRVRVQVVAPDTTNTMVAGTGDTAGPAVAAVPTDEVEVASVDATPVSAPLPTEYRNPPPPRGQVETVPPSESPVSLPAQSKVYVQAGAFTALDNAKRLAAALERLATVQLAPTTQAGGQMFYRVRLGPLASMDEADAVLSQVVGLGHGNARIVVD